MGASVNHGDQFRAGQKLLSAVLALAIRDSQRRPIRPLSKKKEEPSPLTLSALNFLFTDNSDVYLMFLDIDPEQFRKRLIKYMYDIKPKDKEEDKIKKANFQFNYAWYYEMQQKLSVSDMYREDSADMEDATDLDIVEITEIIK